MRKIEHVSRVHLKSITAGKDGASVTAKTLCRKLTYFVYLLHFLFDYLGTLNQLRSFFQHELILSTTELYMKNIVALLELVTYSQGQYEK